MLVEENMRMIDEAIASITNELQAATTTTNGETESAERVQDTLASNDLKRDSPDHHHLAAGSSEKPSKRPRKLPDKNN